MIVGTRDQPQRYARSINRKLQISDRFANARPGAVIQPRENMGDAGDDCYAVINERTHHLKRCFDAARTVTNSRRYIAVQINHARLLVQTLLEIV
jgi:hypothetical protein